MLKAKVFTTCLLLALFLDGTYANVAASRVCGGSLFVQDEVVIDAATFENCVWEIRTQNDHVLAFTIVNGDLASPQDFLSIYDGVGKDSKVLPLKSQGKGLSSAVYTTRPEAKVRFENAPTTLKLKIQKAVDCPFNLGSETQCGRVVDDVSCYCVTYSKRSQSDQRKFCSDHGMLLLSLESKLEEDAIKKAWGSVDRFWTSLTDEDNEGYWIWMSTMETLNGYVNWYPGQPDNGGAFYNEHCMTMNNPTGWGDTQCKDSWDAICENHPDVSQTRKVLV